VQPDEYSFDQTDAARVVGLSICFPFIASVGRRSVRCQQSIEADNPAGAEVDAGDDR
jgi:hypothetical protein